MYSEPVTAVEPSIVTPPLGRALFIATEAYAEVLTANFLRPGPNDHVTRHVLRDNYHSKSVCAPQIRLFLEYGNPFPRGDGIVVRFLRSWFSCRSVLNSHLGHAQTGVARLACCGLGRLIRRRAYVAGDAEATIAASGSRCHRRALGRTART